MKGGGENVGVEYVAKLFTSRFTYKRFWYKKRSDRSLTLCRKEF